MLITTKVSELCTTYPVLVLGALKNSPIPGYLTWIKNPNNVMQLNPKHVSTLPSYVAIRNGIYTNWLKKKETTNPDDMDIKDKIVLGVMNWASADEIENNTIGKF